MRTRANVLLILFLMTVLGISCLGYSKWYYDVKHHGVSFKKARFSKSGTIIAVLKSDADILGWPCRKGWIHFNEDWSLQNCTLSKNVDYKDHELPAGTWIELDRTGYLRMCSFPENITIQGFTCIGTGGPKGAQVTLYPDGRLKYFFSEDDIIIDGVPVKNGQLALVALHPDGSLMECTLADDTVIDGITLKKGRHIYLDDNGHLIK